MARRRRRRPTPSPSPPSENNDTVSLSCNDAAADFVYADAKSVHVDRIAGIDVPGVVTESFSYKRALIIGCLLLLFFVLPQIAYMSTRSTGEGGAIDRIAENVPKGVEYIPSEGADTSSDADVLDRTFTNSPMEVKVRPPKIQVFISFRGVQLRNNFVSYLVDALRRSGINVFIDSQEQRAEDINALFKRINDSGIAIVVFSSRYTESEWCLEELVTIKERVYHGLLKVFPIFYKVTPTNVKRLKGVFGDYFRDKEHTYESDEPMIKRWKEAIRFVSHKLGLTLDENSSAVEIDFVETIVKEVLKILQSISKVESGQSSR